MRIQKIKIVTIIIFLFLIASLIRIQVFSYPYYKKLSQQNVIRVIPIRAARGDIYDRNGKILARSKLSFNVAVIPNEVRGENYIFESLSQILKRPVASLKNQLRNNTINPYTPAVIAEDIPKEEAIAIEEQSMKLKGVIIQTSPMRKYMHPESLAHVIGYVSKVDRDEYKKLKFYGYKPVDLIGRTGIEKTFDSYLRGKDGGYQIETDSRGREVSLLSHKKPIKGKDIYLTIDIDLQDYVYKLVKNRKAAISIWNLKNGKILTLVSSPSFDPNIFISPTREEGKKIKLLFLSKSYPLIDRNIQAEYPPGSIFKIVTAMAALETNSIGKDQIFNCTGSIKLGGRIFHCWKKSGHGKLNIIGALKNSCNVFFYKTGLRIGADNLNKYATMFRLGQKTGINLPNEVTGFVPSKQWKLRTKHENWYDGDTVIFSIGQGYLLVTPLQMLRVISVIATDGYLISPQIIEKIGNVKFGSKSPRNLNLKKENIKIVTEGLKEVVSEYGTGAKAQVEGLPIAGKTATAQVQSASAHAWFICFFPADKPQYAMVVFIEHGGSGGFEAAPLGKKIITYMRDNLMQDRK